MLFEDDAPPGKIAAQPRRARARARAGTGTGTGTGTAKRR
jgi:hypothetical protein